MGKTGQQFVFIFFALLLTPAAAFAQEASGSVPEEFVRAIVGDDAALLFGQLPEYIQETFRMPGGSRVIGSVVQDSWSTTYLLVTEDPDAVLVFFREQLVSGGWRTPEEPEPRRGFQRPRPPQAAASGGFCGPAGQMLSVSASERGNGTIALLRYYPVYPTLLPCDRPSQTSRRSELEDHMPILDLPPSESQRNTTRGGGMDSRWSGVELRTEQTAPQIADHVAEQLEAAGWVPGFTANDEETAVRTWTRLFEDGFQAQGSLLVIAMRPGTYDVLFRLTRVAER